jgi:phosphate transport system permease protein
MRRRVYDRIVQIILIAIASMMALFLIYLVGYIIGSGIRGFSFGFLTRAPSGITQTGGVWPMIASSMYLIGLTLLIAVPLGVGGGIYLAEYAGQGRIVETIRFAVDILSSVPSIVFGLFGLALFVQFFGLKYSMLSGALTLTLMVLPLLLKISEESFRAVPVTYREASLALGATKDQTIFRIILPTALPAVFTGVLLSAGRAFGETAAVLYTAGLSPTTPVFPLDGGRTLSTHLYLLATTGKIEESFKVAMVLLVVILVFNVLSNVVISRFRRRFIKEAR